MIRRARPGLPDAEMIAHVLLGAPHSEPVPAHLAADGPQRPAAAVRALARAVLDAPGLPARREPHGAQAGCRTSVRGTRRAVLRDLVLSKTCLMKVGSRW